MIASALEAPEPEPTRRKDSIVEQIGINPGKYGLENHGILNAGRVFWNLSPAALIEQSLERNEGELTETGALAVRTGKRTGRSPKDRFIVQRSPSQEHIAWGSVNVPIEPGKFTALRAKVMAQLEERDLFVRDCWAGADPKYRMPIRVITEFAWHNLFAAALFVRPEAGEAAAPEFTIVVVPSFHSDPGADGTNSDAFVMIDFEQKMVLIGGMHYAGEIKKSVFSILNFLLPLKGVLSMHCSANIGEQGDVALFFGLSGTGKTTLSADPDRRLIGDDEHGWSDRGVFNFEGGCYAKCIRLSREYEPQIYNAIRFGAVVENAVIDASTRCPDYDDGSLTENTRVGYPLDYIENAVLPSVGGHPRNVVFLTCDAFGVLPPISRLTPEQAMYHFLSGYTAKVAGTEAGVTEPQTTFSSCFGSPFLPLDPTVYAGMLGKNLAEHKAACWLVNTGWTGGPYGTGERINLRQTRAIIKALLDGSLAEVPTEPDPIFGLFVPTTCPGVPAEILSPRSTWSDPSAYDKKAKDLAARFVRNFEQFTEASPAVKQAGPTECEPVS